MDSLALRVAQRFKHGEIGGLPPMLQAFRRVVEYLEEKVQEVGAADPYRAQMLAAVAVSTAFSLVSRQGLSLLFLGLLQQRQMNTTDLRVIERAAQTFAKKSIRRVKRDVAVGALQKTLDEYRLFLETAQRVLTTGLQHAEETTLKAGPFTLINAGGFPSKAMEDVVKVVEKAAQQLASKGLSKVCYGSIQVTNTVGRSTRVLAFYLVNKDEMFVRANLKGKQGPAITSIVHELGHRLHYKFLRSKDAEIKKIYAQLARKNEVLLDDPYKTPKPGEKFEERGKTYVVTGISTNNRWETVINLALESDPAQKARISLKGWLSGTGVSAFVSPYASTNHSENFAEMIAHYCQDTLPDDQVEMLKSVL